MDTLLSLSVAELAFTCGVKMFRVVKALATKSLGVLYAVLYGVFTGLYGTYVELCYSVVYMLSCPAELDTGPKAIAVITEVIEILLQMCQLPNTPMVMTAPPATASALMFMMENATNSNVSHTAKLKTLIVFQVSLTAVLNLSQFFTISATPPGTGTTPGQDGNVKTKTLGDGPDDISHTFVASGACHDHHGFDLIDKDQNVDTECIICYETTTSPLKTSCCKRLICRTCLFRLEEYNHVCPMCRSDFEVHVDENTLRLMARCKYAGSGCPWVGTLKEGIDHVERECPFVEPTTVDTAAHGFQHHKTVETTTKEWQYEELYDAKQEYLLSELNNVEVDGNEDDEDDSDMPERATESIAQMKQCVKNTEPFDDSAVKMERIENMVGEEVLVAYITANRHTKLCAAAHSMVKIHFPELKDDPDPTKRQEVMSNHLKEQDGGGDVSSDGVEHDCGGGGHGSENSSSGGSSDGVEHDGGGGGHGSEHSGGGGGGGGGGGSDEDGHNSDGDGDRHSGGDCGGGGGSDGDGHDGGDSGGDGDRHAGRDSGGGGSGSNGDGHGDGGGGSDEDKGTSEDKSDEGGGGDEDNSGSGSSSMQGSHPECINSPYHNQARDASTVNSEDAPSLQKNDVRTFSNMASVSHAMMHASGQSHNEPQTSSSQSPTCGSDSSPVAARRHKRKKRKRRGQQRAPVAARRHKRKKRKRRGRQRVPGSRSRQWNTPSLVPENYVSQCQSSGTSNQPLAENLSVTLSTPVVNQKNPSETTELVVSKPGVKVPKQEERLVFGRLCNSMQNLRASERNHSLYSSSSVHRPQRVLAYPNEDRVSNGSPHQPTAEEQGNNSAFVFCAPSGGSLTPVKLQSGSVGSTVHHFGLPSPTAFVPAVLREELSRAPIPVYFKNSSSMRGWSLLNYSVECGKTGNLNGFFTILLSLIKCQLAFLSHTPIIIGPEIVRIGVEGKSILLNVCDPNDKLTSLSGFYQMLVDALLLFQSSIKQSHLPHTIVENCMCVLESLLSAAQTHRTLDVIRTLLLSNL